MMTEYLAPAPIPWGANPFMSVEFFLTVGLLVSVLLGGAVVFYFVDRWRKRQLNPGRESTDSLTMFRSMFEQGEITEAEYHKVRDRVAARMREEVALPAAGGGGLSPSPQPLPPPPELPRDAPPDGPSSENPSKDQNSPLT
jgi:hypothetical protein